jgi:hypothetical protein
MGYVHYSNNFIASFVFADEDDGQDLGEFPIDDDDSMFLEIVSFHY